MFANYRQVIEESNVVEAERAFGVTPEVSARLAVKREETFGLISRFIAKVNPGLDQKLAFSFKEIRRFTLDDSGEPAEIWQLVRDNGVKCTRGKVLFWVHHNGKIEVTLGADHYSDRLRRDETTGAPMFAESEFDDADSGGSDSLHYITDVASMVGYPCEDYYKIGYFTGMLMSRN